NTRLANTVSGYADKFVQKFGLNLQSTLNTVLIILGMLGVITDVQTVNVSQDTTGTLEHVTNEVDSASQADKSTN
ncbi:hypothetical protein, partial [Lactiplantibacillus plantarum]|uniref:hypothetical protein n=1 Tax=Lactiplantibacillus plantarum TaxID=1590 RepID=UPI0021821596